MAPLWPKRGKGRKLFILSIDGVPFSLLQEAFEQGRMPEFRKLSEQGSLVKMNSVIPPISSVAWATFITGVNPAKHNIYGFVDRDEEMGFFIPTGAHMRAKTLWERLNEHDRRTIVINVPGTYPPRPVNGTLISGFLGADLDKITYPREVAGALKEIGYIIDPDSQKAKSDKEAFLEELFESLRKRREAAFRFMKEDWDFFMLHVMGTDRINHFFWEAKDDRSSGYHQRFWEFYSRVDDLIGEVHAELPRGTAFIVLSDHGFCQLRAEVDLNEYLRGEGFLKYQNTAAKKLSEIHPDSLAYSLIPGRIFVNLKGREKNGTVTNKEYEIVRVTLSESLRKLSCPETGAQIIEHIYKKEEIYSGPYSDRAADLIALSHRGYDLKGKINSGKLFERSHIEGMHTYDDAALFVKGKELKSEERSIIDVTPLVFVLMGLPVPSELEGQMRL